jgi:hypothetical protein
MRSGMRSAFFYENIISARPQGSDLQDERRFHTPLCRLLLFRFAGA